MKKPKVNLLEAIKIRGRIRRKEATVKQIAEQYGLTIPYVQSIVHRTIYKFSLAEQLRSRRQVSHTGECNHLFTDTGPTDRELRLRER
jgi:hypothetical protein